MATYQVSIGDEVIELTAEEGVVIALANGHIMRRGPEGWHSPCRPNLIFADELIESVLRKGLVDAVVDRTGGGDDDVGDYHDNQQNDARLAAPFENVTAVRANALGNAALVANKALRNATLMLMDELAVSEAVQAY